MRKHRIKPILCFYYIHATLLICRWVLAMNIFWFKEWRKPLYRRCAVQRLTCNMLDELITLSVYHCVCPLGSPLGG